MYEVVSQRFLEVTAFLNREFNGVWEFLATCDRTGISRPILSPLMPYQRVYYESGEMVLRMSPRYEASEIVRHSIILEPWSCYLLNRIQRDRSFAEWVVRNSEGVIWKWCCKSLADE